MEWMDGARRWGGFLWVAAGLVLGAWAALSLGVLPGPITTRVCVVVVALAVSILAGWARASVVLGWVATVALGLDFLAAVADRFGLLGGPGSPGVWWGIWAAFVSNVTAMLHGVGGWVAAALAVGATAAEVVLGIALLTGWQRRWVGKAAAGLLGAYLVLMWTSVGVAEVARFALPVLVGGALLASATPRSARVRARLTRKVRRLPPSPKCDIRAGVWFGVQRCPRHHPLRPRAAGPTDGTEGNPCP
jgi:hypothetical protein